MVSARESSWTRTLVTLAILIYVYITPVNFKIGGTNRNSIIYVV